MSEKPIFTRVPETKHAVTVYEAECEVKVGAMSWRTHARVVFDVTQFPSAVIEVADLDVHTNTRESVSIRFVNSGFELSRGDFCSLIGKRPMRYPFQGGVRFTEPIAVHGQRRIKFLTAVLYNMDAFSFNGTPFPQAQPLHLKDASYEITIATFKEFHGAALTATKTPWQVPTHLLNVKIDGEGELGEEIERLLFELQQFLSFACGHRVGVALARGTDDQGDLAFAHWGMLPPDPCVPSFNQDHWFSPNRAEVLQEILPGYIQMVRDPEWKDQLDWALYWWLSANHVSQCAETAILASVAGLEVVTLTLKDRGDLKPIELPQIGKNRRGGGRSVPAKDIRGLLSLMKIPAAIGGQLAQLRKLAEEQQRDGPEALAEIRNSLAHPARRDDKGAAFEASQLAMWYLEMALLYLFKFNGNCENRTVFEKSYDAQEPVPWAALRDAS